MQSQCPTQGLYRSIEYTFMHLLLDVRALSSYASMSLEDILMEVGEMQAMSLFLNPQY